MAITSNKKEKKKKRHEQKKKQEHVEMYRYIKQNCNKTLYTVYQHIFIYGDIPWVQEPNIKLYNETYRQDIRFQISIFENV